jgi:hypothetical protein
MSNQIPGVPESWELVRIDNPTQGEWFIDGVGLPKEYLYKTPCGGKFPIIRKIEKPAKYRPFVNAREADQFWNASLRLAGVTGDAKDSRFRITTIGMDGITTNLEFYSYEKAFSKFCIDDDGTPFGVKTDE